MRPSPGPSTTAPARSAISTRTSTPSGVCPPSACGSARVIASSSRRSSAGSTGSGTAAWTYPAPARWAASAAIAGAPVNPAAPPATTTVPDANLFPSRPRRGNNPSTPSLIKPAVDAPGASRGIPISITDTRPAQNAPGPTCNPIFDPWNVAVATARTASPSTSPVEAFTPDGTSQATTGKSPSLIAVIAPATGSRGTPSNPVPSIASTMQPDPSSASGENATGPSPGSRSRFAAASPRSSAGIGKRQHVDLSPLLAQQPRHHQPVPAVVALPDHHAHGAGPRHLRDNPRKADPARSIRSSDGTPAFSIAYASAARISSAVNSGSSQSGRVTSGG